jgi:hypothetical protein
MLKRLVLPLLLALAFAPSALAGGGNYSFDGGTRAQQAQVKAALDASSFDWSLVRGRIAIHIARGVSPHASAGQIWLDADLLDAGRFSWGVVQHEYAHQIDFTVLTDDLRARLHTLLGGSSWWAGAEHSQLDCERFADAVAWSYWQSTDNVMKPDSPTDEGGQVEPAAFRAVLATLLAPAAVRLPASVRVRQHPRNGLGRVRQAADTPVTRARR